MRSNDICKYKKVLCILKEVVSFMYSPFSLTWLMTNDFQVEFFSFNYRKQKKLSVR